MNIAQWLVRASRAFPNHVAVAHGIAPHATYRELAERAAALAHYFRSTLRCESGERIGLAMPNCPAYLEVLAGIWWAGLAAVPINPGLDAKEVSAILDHAGASCCFTGPADAAASIALIGEHRTIDVTSARYRALVQSGQAAPITWCGPDDVAWLFYTGGGTVPPKGVMLSHRNLLAMTLCYMADVDAVRAADCVIHAAPLSQGSGLYGLPHMAAAATQVVPEGGMFDPDEIFVLARQWHGATMLATRTMGKRMIDHVKSLQPALEPIKTITFSAGSMQPGDCAEALATLGPRIVKVYGPAECPMAVTALSKFHLADSTHPRFSAHLRSIGVPQSAVEVRVVDALDHVLPPGAKGEIIVRGDPVMRGYWMNPRATAATLKGGWLHTGDIGAFDEDGFLTLADEADDRIVVGSREV